MRNSGEPQRNWDPMTMLPAATMPYSALGISLYHRNAHFGTTGW